MKALLMVLVWLSAVPAYAGGVRFGIGCVGVCGLEQTVFDGQTTCVVAMDNIASDDDMLRVKTISLAVDHADGSDVQDDIILAPDGFPPAILISPHAEFQQTFVLRPHASDLTLPNAILPLRVKTAGDVLFGGAKNLETAPSSGDVEFASFGDITHVLDQNPPVCAQAAMSPAPVMHYARVSVAHLLRHPIRHHVHWFHRVHG